ncbi:MAG: hypothetical protein N2327_05575 [Caldimicrobium sp.]|nr:hypothetical protein [Caldimicrobium sp.]MCX7873881.1 hypothetical protein [Caldimicrobium sp.]
MAPKSQSKLSVSVELRSIDGRNFFYIQTEDIREEMLKEVATGGNRIYPGLQERTSSHGKEKLKPLVNKFCRERGIALVAVSTIGRIIKYLKERGLSLRRGSEEA